MEPSSELEPPNPPERARDIDAKRQHIEEVRAELIASGESPEDVERWLQQHLAELEPDKPE